jgi:hypothetical protein
MKLNDDEKKILDGGQGAPARQAMEMLRAIGEIYDAEKLIAISSAHIAGLSYKSHGDAGMEYVENLAASGAKINIPTTLNVIGVDRLQQPALGLPAEWASHQWRIGRAYEKMGCFGTFSCTPYYTGFVPRLGEHVAWAESSAIIFINSVLGARDNREGGPTALASALTGKTPFYGLHLDKNRKGTLHVKVTTELKRDSDYGALGAYVAKRVGPGIPVFDGLRPVYLDQFVDLGAALASSGAAGMFHIIGVTPEAPDLKAAFGTADAPEIIETGEKEIEEGYSQLTSWEGGQVEYVATGCPHLNLRRLAEVALLLQGRKVCSGVRFWVHTSAAIRALAQQIGLIDILEKAGATVTQDLCTVLGNPEALGIKTLVTNSAKMAFYAPGSNDMKVKYASLEQCVEAAVQGRI